MNKATLAVLTLLCACGSSNSPDPSGTDMNSGNADTSDGTSSQDAGKSEAKSDASVASKDAGKTAAKGDAAAGKDAGSEHCAAGSPDQSGCPCTKANETRACYTGPSATRGVGSCRDGKQTCAASGEFGSAFSDCTGEVLPSGDSCTVKDAGPPPSKCMMVQGANGNGTNADGTLFCEDDFGGGLGGIFGGFFGAADAGP